MILSNMNCSSEKKEVNRKKKGKYKRKLHLLKVQRGEDALARREKFDEGTLTN